MQPTEAGREWFDGGPNPLNYLTHKKKTEIKYYLVFEKNIISITRHIVSFSN